LLLEHRFQRLQRRQCCQTGTGGQEPQKLTAAAMDSFSGGRRHGWTLFVQLRLKFGSQHNAIAENFADPIPEKQTIEVPTTREELVLNVIPARARHRREPLFFR
jgi:hypothetical protein